MTHSTFNGRGAPRHLILRQIGHGHLTRIFLAMPRPALLAPSRVAPPGELVVLKLLHPELTQDDDFRAMYLDQAAATLSLRHPHLVRTRDVVAEPDACGLAMEFSPGQTLASVLDRVGRQRFPVDLHLHILSKVLEALDYAHEFAAPGHAEPGFLHRDVCPNNVFITYDGRIQLLGTGFGEALRALESRLGRPLMDVRYAAPELLLGQPAGPRADLFGVGVMIWEALSRQARVRSDDPKEVVRRRTTGEEPDLESAWPDAAQPLVELCSRALALDPHDRHATARTFRADLDAYLSRSVETSEAVLGRLPELMAASFGAEYEQMQRFIDERIAGAEAAAVAIRQDDVDDALTPHGDERTKATNATALLGDRAELDHPRSKVSNVGLRRAHPDPGIRARETGVHRKEPQRTPAEPRLVQRVPRGRASRLLGPRDGDTCAPEVPELAEPALPSSLEPPASQEATTAGHRAYSSNLESAGRARRGLLRLSPDVLGAAALLVGSLVATYSVYRHTQRDKKPESEGLAIQADTHGPAPAATLPRLVPAQPLPPATPLAPALDPVDAGPELGERVPGPAFFDGQAAADLQRKAPPSLRADELPTVDPALRSLQDAIVVSAKAHRLALQHRRAKKADAARRSSAAASEAAAPGEAEAPSDPDDPLTPP
ncbi:MAG TPA: serine/threonine-protein kinase [Polyangiaceae bacterium]|nr:serine/threonine-protein kinase [Polyangiaceae bacterium]